MGCGASLGSTPAPAAASDPPLVKAADAAVEPVIAGAESAAATPPSAAEAGAAPSIAVPKAMLRSQSAAMMARPYAPTVFVLYASDTADKADFVAAIRGDAIKMEYDIERATAADMKAMIEKASQQAGGKFTAVALAGHGSHTDSGIFSWELTKHIKVADVSELESGGAEHPLMVVMHALGDVVEPNGRVDLFACALLKSPPGLAAFEHIEKMTTTHFAASDDLTGNVKDGADWVMESDGTDVEPVYFDQQKLAEFDGTFGGRYGKGGYQGGVGGAARKGYAAGYGGYRGERYGVPAAREGQAGLAKGGGAQAYHANFVEGRTGKSNDRRITFDEFNAALPLIESWGCLVTDPFLEFAKLDVNGGGMITFDEWAHWAFEKHLDLPEDDDAPEPLPPLFANLSEATLKMVKGGNYRDVPGYGTEKHVTAESDSSIAVNAEEVANAEFKDGYMVRNTEAKREAMANFEPKAEKPREDGDSQTMLSSEKYADNLNGHYNLDWAALTAKLPMTLSQEDREARKRIWNAIDVNGNGYLSLAEVDKGVRDVLQIAEIYSAKPVMMRAFHAAKGGVRSKARLGPDFVERGKEFRLLLLYLRHYFELYVMFNRIDV